jgi:serine/threonine protein kinase
MLGIYIGQAGFKYLATEFMPKGDLLSLIKKDTSITEIDMLKMARQAAAGMSYLESKGIVHRFCLVTYKLTYPEILLFVTCS